MRSVLIAALVLTLAACGSMYDRRMQNYVGQNIQTVIERTGLPSQTMELPTGNTIYEWRFRGDVVIRHVGQKSYASQASCITGFETDDDGTILRYYWRGSCR